MSRSEDLATFAARLGRVMYGPDWKGPFPQGIPSNDSNIGTNDETTFLVHEQIVGGIRAGKVTVLTRVVVGSRARKVDPRPKVRAARDVDEDVFDADYRWTISPDFWYLDAPINWSESSVEVPSDLLLAQEGDGMLSDYFEPELAKTKVYLRVANPDSVLRNLVKFVELPNDKWFARYNQNSSIVSREIIASAWRSIAIAALDNVNLGRKQLIEAMRDYNNWAGLTASDDAVTNLADKVLARWKNKDLSGPAFFHSTRDVPKNPRSRGASKSKPSM